MQTPGSSHAWRLSLSTAHTTQLNEHILHIQHCVSAQRKKQLLYINYTYFHQYIMTKHTFHTFLHIYDFQYCIFLYEKLLLD